MLYHLQSGMFEIAIKKRKLFTATGEEPATRHLQWHILHQQQM
jgi:hypothetical protein